MTDAITVDDLREFAHTFVDREPARLGSEGWWQAPLLATAPVDSRFDQLPQIAADDHVLPRDLLTGARSVIVFFIPFKKDLVKENRQGDRPCRNWGRAYVQTNDLIGRLTQALGDLLAERGLKSGLTPATHNFDEIKLMARWSHKHLAHLVNLGRFGIHHMLITTAGSTGRLGSLLTDAELGDHPLIQTREEGVPDIEIPWEGWLYSTEADDRHRLTEMLMREIDEDPQTTSWWSEHPASAILDGPEGSPARP